MTKAADDWRSKVWDLLEQMHNETQNPSPSAMGESFCSLVCGEASELWLDPARDEVLG